MTCTGGRHWLFISESQTAVPGDVGRSEKRTRFDYAVFHVT